MCLPLCYFREAHLGALVHLIMDVLHPPFLHHSLVSEAQRLILDRKSFQCRVFSYRI